MRRRKSLPIADIEAAGYGAVWHGQKGFNGVAILAQGRHARTPADRASRRSRRHAQPLYRGRGRRARRRLDLSAQRQSDRHREVRLQAELDGAARSARQRTARSRAAGVLAGDWNVVPEDRDVFSVRAAAQRRARAARDPRRSGARIVNQGWTDALRALHPGRATSSTPSGTIRRAAGSATPASASTICSARPKPPTGCVGAGVDKWARAQEKASDHAPTWVELATKSCLLVRSGRRG